MSCTWRIIIKNVYGLVKRQIVFNILFQIFEKYTKKRHCIQIKWTSQQNYWWHGING